MENDLLRGCKRQLVPHQQQCVMSGRSWPITKQTFPTLFSNRRASPFFLRCMYQERKVRGHVFVCWGYQFCLFLRYCYLILELFRHCSIFVFHFITDSFSCTPDIYTSTNKTDRHDITEILLKVALSTITPLFL